MKNWNCAMLGILMAVAVGATVLSGCGQDQNEKLQKENTALKEKIKSQEQEIARLKGPDPKQAAPTANPNAVAPVRRPVFTDPAGIIQVQINRILVGQAAMDNAFLYDWQRQHFLKQGKDMVYFDVTVKNLGSVSTEVVRAHPAFFSLEDTQGNTYSAEETQNDVDAEVHRNKQARGSVGFAIYKDAIPSVLIFGHSEAGEDYYAKSPSLRKIFRSLDQ